MIVVIKSIIGALAVINTVIAAKELKKIIEEEALNNGGIE